MNECPDYVPLHVHTHYSTLDGMAKVDKLVAKAIADGMRGMAITDHGNMFAIKEFFDECNKVNAKRKDNGEEPFKPIFGCEMYVAHRRKSDKEASKGDRSGWHLIVLAKNENGYKNLINLVSRSWVDGFYDRPRTDREDLMKYHEDLIVCSACLGGEVPKKILAGDMEGAREAVEWYKNLFGDDYYLELQRHEVKNPTVRANREVFPLQEKVNKVLIEFAKEYNIKLVCTNDSHFVDEDDAEAHDHLICLGTGKKFDDEDRLLYTKQEWMKTRAEMAEIFSDVPESLTNTGEILDKVEVYNIESNPIMPFFPIPEDFGTEELWRQKFSEEDLFREFTSDENGENPLPEEEGQKKIKKLGGFDKLYRIKFEADYLAKLAYDGAKKIYGEPLSHEVDERIRFELHIMKTMGFPGYFLIVQDFINSARDQLGVWVGPGRGSAAGSVVAYCLGITRLDPLKYDLLFERFLNPDRISLPDIDTDFDDDGRGKVLQWVMDKYGHENCAHIITYGTLATKNAIKDMGRVEGLPIDITNALCKAIPDRLPDGLKPTFDNIVKCTPELQEAEESNNESLKRTIQYARKVVGNIRGTGIHACGFIICRDPISDHVPISTAEDPDFKGVKVAVTQYDGHVIESTGLIKMDFLGLKTLSEMKEAVKNIKLSRGIDVDVDSISIDDELTYKLYQEGRTVGTFQFESPGMQKHLRELHPTVFGDLIAMNALYRPGPMDNIPSFIARKQGREEISYPIPVMEKYLKDTYGITVYQEQVMLLSRLLAGFTRGQSDTLRKAMGKKKIKDMEKLEKLFYEGGEKRGYDRKILGEIWEEWKKFASYAFNKSHAACYSWVAFQTAYLKAHYPAEYLAALLTRRSSDIKDVTKLMDECKAMNIATLIPDVNESFAHFGVNERGEIRFGLSAISGIGEEAAQTIINERMKNGKFSDVYDFQKRLACNKSMLEKFVLSGAMDCFGISREQYFELNKQGQTFIELLAQYGQSCANDRMEQCATLFGDEEAFEITKPSIPPMREEWSSLHKLNEESKLIGIYLSAHPLDEYYAITMHKVTNKCAEVTDVSEIPGDKLVVAGIVKDVNSNISKKGKPYGIVKIEDYSGECELRFFGNEWGAQSGFFNKGTAIYLTCRLETSRWDESRKFLTIENVRYLEDIKNTLIQEIAIELSLSELEEIDIEELLQNIEPGNVTLKMMLKNPKNKTMVKLASNTKIAVTRHLLDYLERQNISFKL